ncbi:hypothetical protein BACEGG_03595 [Bacteroides eggerthii DSM 20697]|nr:hypothetical protein BACEGG_03595 [Bacteroides eggerthii DSM 20697]
MFIQKYLFCRKEKKSFIVIITTIWCKDNANREQNKMNLFIFYAGMRFIFAFGTKIMQFGRIAMMFS